jgi:phosphatidylserine decarboxylase
VNITVRLGADSINRVAHVSLYPVAGPTFEIKLHQFVERDTGRVCTEEPFGDWIIKHLYSEEREENSLLFRLLGSRWVSDLLRCVNYDFPWGPRISGLQDFLDRCRIDLDECDEAPEQLNSARKVFERKIRYWICRPMNTDPRAILSPADARVLLGSLSGTSSLFLKGKFFDLQELLTPDKDRWLSVFMAGDYVISRLTPEKYHYNHTPVAGRVVDIYESGGSYHSCHPDAVIALATPFSKNKRVVTVIDTDTDGGTGIGLVATIEVVALMIGDIVQCYSETQYLDPRTVQRGMFLRKGCPKSLYRPGSSTTVLLFQENRVDFAPDLLRNLHRQDVWSRFSESFGRSLVETDLKVRSTIGARKEQTSRSCDDRFAI